MKPLVIAAVVSGFAAVVIAGCTIWSEVDTADSSIRSALGGEPDRQRPPEPAPSANPAPLLPRERIEVDTLFREKEIVGRLGKPLGEFSTIKGVWKSRGDVKFDPFEFHVIEVDGKELKNAVVFAGRDVGCNPEFGGDRPERADDVTWEFRGYEAIESYGYPPKWRQEGILGQGRHDGMAHGKPNQIISDSTCR